MNSPACARGILMQQRISRQFDLRVDFRTTLFQKSNSELRGRQVIFVREDMRNYDYISGHNLVNAGAVKVCGNADSDGYDRASMPSTRRRSGARDLPLS